MAGSGRHLARRCAVQAIYQWQITGQAPAEIEDGFIKNARLSRNHLDYFLKLIHSVPEHVERIDAVIFPHLDREPEKIDLIEHAIIRVSTYELLFEGDIHQNIIIDEAIDLARIFAAEQSYKFVNGVLDKVAGEVRRDN